MEESKLVGKMKATQQNVNESRGRSRQIYIKADVEKRALEYCERENASMSLLIRLALDSFLEKEGL